jgi:hypothetical protein
MERIHPKGVAENEAMLSATPLGVKRSFALNRWCRFAQPPAIGFKPFGFGSI